MSKKIYSIDLLKLYGAIAIALSHFSFNIAGIYYFVELFFLISGFFLANKFFRTEKPQGAVGYTVDRAKKLFPHYIFSFLILLAYKIFLSVKDTGASLKDVALMIYDGIPEALFLQNIGVSDGGINYPLWYVSSLLLAGYFLWQLLLINKNVTLKVICPALVLLVYTYLFGAEVDIFSWKGIFYLPLWRSFAAVALGILTYSAAKSTWYETNKNKVWFNIIGTLALVLMFTVTPRNSIQLVIMPLVILFLYNGDSFINKIFSSKIFGFSGELSYAIYLNHALIIMIMKRCLPNIPHQKAVFLAILIAYSVLTGFMVKYILKGFDRLKNLKKQKAEI